MLDLYLIDERVTMQDALIRFLPRGTPVVGVLHDESISAAAQAALSRLQEPQYRGQPIRTLTIDAHGNAGFMQLGTGLTLATVDEFAPLVPRMAAGLLGRVRLFGCSVAAGTPVSSHQREGYFQSGRWAAWGPGSRGDYMLGAGYQLMRRLAEQFRCNVSAGADTQNPASRIDHRRVRGYAFDGPMMTVDPLGGFVISTAGGVTLDSRFDTP